MLKNLIFALILAIPFSIVNFNGYLMGGAPTQSQVIASIIFNILWFLFGAIMAYKKRLNFILFTTLYWLIGGFLGVLSYWLNSLEMAILPILLFSGPSYGLKYFIELRPGKDLFITCLGISYSLSLLGYFLGWLIVKRKLREN